ncbi:hypothetical protein ARAM_007422 [Aspergillus rambellii]|uniref:Uncharacterized protein n=1 Tax=Aspergillus rambellii TaxID=308745 RepID=A0A0F8X2U9_9EURO|nr:hypothetical protein ARAM_007422 [Aspergillus rambellii]
MSRRWSNLRCCTVALLASTAAATSASFPENANHIFNAVHSSMRQWGSSLNHNGMSFFLATVPEGTQLYHGSGSSDPVKSPEWVAFEPEHALNFAHRRRPPPGSHDPPPPPRPDGHGPPPPGFHPDFQHVMQDPVDGNKAGFLHTFAAKKDLRLLYVDGMSAGKTNNGTLDAEDRILFHDQRSDGNGMAGEEERATEFCRMARDRWGGRLDGLIRMEAGFEIILCDLATDMDALRVTRVQSSPNGGPPGSPGNGKERNPTGNSWVPAVASRYWGIGGNRVILNYDHFVTAYVYGLDLFGAAGETERSNSSHVLPRLAHLSAHKLEPMRQDLDALIWNHDATERSVDWQAVADMVVERYAKRLRYLASGQVPTIEELQEEIEGLVTPFIDYDARNSSLEVERCSMQFIRRSAPTTTVAGDAVLSVSRSICATLLETLRQTEHSTAVGQIQDLVNYLSWSNWKKCTGCGDHELCVIPMWPMGTVEDYEHPQCRDLSQLEGDGPRYWGGFPGRRKPAPFRDEDL